MEYNSNSSICNNKTCNHCSNKPKHLNSNSNGVMQQSNRNPYSTGKHFLSQDLGNLILDLHSNNSIPVKLSQLLLNHRSTLYKLFHLILELLSLRQRHTLAFLRVSVIRMITLARDLGLG